MTASDTAQAIALIDAELKNAGVPEQIAETLAPSILGALTGRYMFIPHPTAHEEEATRAELAELGIPGLFNATKGSNA